MKVDILAIGVHPDDIELSCSGTLLRHIAQGKTAGLLDLTQGELGTRGSARLRLEEAATAASLMGAAFRKNLGMADGFFSYTRENIIKIIEVVREHQPEIVLANALADRHPDHGRAARLVADACFYSGLVKIPTAGPDGTPHERWRPRALYHYIQDHNLEPDFVVDITPFIDKKIELAQAFRSQVFVPGAKEFEEELNSPISGEDFIEFLRAKARAYGRAAGFEYAEGYNVARTPGVNDLFSLI
ncbi:MAG: bacillithiol biosynthesis deacetylase BshB1 [Phaeodactylibacter sp.]|nr:bacillithiol biosynthesis deacetylase BshB1 [Phaeodactylibacter sp.]MCB9294104.1 bacillithiol biosynthesis deacetylase BshB1 [Lewinellaceae bacterium]